MDQVIVTRDRNGKQVTIIRHQGFFGVEQVIVDSKGKMTVIDRDRNGRIEDIQTIQVDRFGNTQLVDENFNTGIAQVTKCPPGCTDYCCLQKKAFLIQYQPSPQMILGAHNPNSGNCLCQKCIIKLCPESCSCLLCCGEVICPRGCECLACKTFSSGKCPINCQCQLCTDLGYTMMASGINWSEKIWQGFVALYVNSPSYKLTRLTLNFTQFGQLKFKNQISQIKYLKQGTTKVPMIKITSCEPETYLVNRGESRNLCANLFRIYIIASRSSFWFPYAPFTGIVDGTLMKRLLFSKKYRPIYVRIDRNGLFQQNKSILRSTNEVWSHFNLSKIYGRAYLQIKLWNKLVKQVYYIPIKNLTIWLEAFFYLVQASFQQ